jgi:uncharacterized Zn-binding protein involved in type VI secretion
MPAVARGNSDDTVASPDGTGYQCESPTTQSTDQCSGNVFINGIGAVRQGDDMIPHPEPGCSTHAPPLTSCSRNVFVNGRGIGRKGDAYGGDHIITSGSGNVFAGG